LNSQKNHRRIDKFEPIVKPIYENISAPFSAGAQYAMNFNRFLSRDVEDYLHERKGITYLIYNGDDIVAYFCVSAGSIPYDYQIDGESELWGISVLEIQMFAVSEKYQNTFFKYVDLDMPIAAWCLYLIYQRLSSYIAFEAVYLHSIPEAEAFYRRNGFKPVMDNMQPLKCIDSEFTPLWMPIKKL